MSEAEPVKNRVKRKAQQPSGAKARPSFAQGIAQKATMQAQLNEQMQSMQNLINLEGEARTIGTRDEFAYFTVNETRRVLNYRQAIFLKKNIRDKWVVTAISSLAMVDRASPFVVWVEDILQRFASDIDATKQREFTLQGYSEKDNPQAQEYPFQEALWLPFTTEEQQADAGLLLLREQPWQEHQLTIGQRVASTFQHAWAALGKGELSASRRWSQIKKTSRWLGAVALLAMFIPVSLTTLAPVEVVARKPNVVAAPIPAVVEAIHVEPNQQVFKGDLLFNFNDTDLRNRFSIASQDVKVASVKLRKAKQSAFSSSDSAHDISTLEAQLNRSQLELAYAKEQLQKVEVRATRDGVVLFSDRSDWVGKPVVVGEQIMRLADPKMVEFSVNVPVKDSIVLNSGARVRVYLDSNPMTPIEATLTSASYHATELPSQQLAYRSFAQVKEGDAEALRIGLRGTAKVYGDDVALFFYLFRRPLSAARQSLGF